MIEDFRIEDKTAGVPKYICNLCNGRLTKSVWKHVQSERHQQLKSEQQNTNSSGNRGTRLLDGMQGDDSQFDDRRVNSGQLDGLERHELDGTMTEGDFVVEETQDSVLDLDLRDLANVIEMFKYSQDSGSDISSANLAADMMWDEMELGDGEELISIHTAEKQEKDNRQRTTEASSSQQHLEWFSYGSQQVRIEWPWRGQMNPDNIYSICRSTWWPF